MAEQRSNFEKSVTISIIGVVVSVIAEMPRIE